jgi:queuine tRNA-ribosyltransferase
MTSSPLKFEILNQAPASAARLGRATTAHGSFDTPAFMPVGTQATVKGILPEMLHTLGAQILLANTYHLMLRPGEKVVAELGDLHAMMGWPGPILTDSGGFQVFSLADINRIDDTGVTFKSHIDGSTIFLDAARSIAVQNDLGADIIMAFDQCPAANAPPDQQHAAFLRTIHWAAQSLAAHCRRSDQALFSIVQGGVDLPLRASCAKQLVEMNFDGYALGGLAVGEGFDAMETVIRHTAPLLPKNKPRYLMGVGYPRDIVAAVAGGIDMFDCVLPTRNGRNAYAFTAAGPLRLRNAQFQRDNAPIEPGCDCPACIRFSRGTLRHLFYAGEMLGPILVSAHNIRFYQRLMADIRQSIARGDFETWRLQDPRCRIAPGQPADSPRSLDD